MSARYHHKSVKESRRAAKAKAQGEAEELAWLSQIKLRDAAKRAQEIIDKRDELIREKKLEAEFATMAKHDRIARLRRQVCACVCVCVCVLTTWSCIYVYPPSHTPRHCSASSSNNSSCSRWRKSTKKRS
jgi:hypothetical protein